MGYGINMMSSEMRVPTNPTRKYIARLFKMLLVSKYVSPVALSLEESSGSVGLIIVSATSHGSISPCSKFN